MRRGAYRACASDGDGMQSVGVRRGRFRERGRLSRAQHGVRATVVGRALRGVRADDESTNVYYPVMQLDGALQHSPEHALATFNHTKKNR